MKVLVSTMVLVASLSLTPAYAEEYASTGTWPGVTWPLSGPKGACTDAAGNVYVADTGHDRVVKFDAAGRLVVAWGGAGTDNGKFNDPYDVACDPAGTTVYVADTKNHRVQQFSVSGTSVQFVRRWGKAGGPDFTGSNPGEFNEPRGIVLDGEGNVYVVDTRNYRIQKFTATGSYIRQWGTAGSDVDKFLEPNGIDISPNGLVYVVDANQTNCYVRAFTTDGVPASFATGGNGWGGYTLTPQQGKFSHPVGITVDDDGYVYVVDSSITSTWVQKFTFDGTFVLGWGKRGYGDTDITGQPLFMTPAGLDASGSGMNVRLLVCDAAVKSGTSSSSGDRLREFSGQGLPLNNRDSVGVLGSHGDAHHRFDTPWDVAEGPGGTVYVADRANHRVQRMNSAGGLDRITPTIIPAMPDARNAYFSEPAAIAYDPVTRFVFVAEAGNNRVQRLTEDLIYEDHKWGASGTGNGMFNKPQGIAVGPSPSGGRWVYVSDTNNNRIQIFEQDGTHKHTITGLLSPGGLVVDDSGTIYCADSGNRRIVRITHNDTWTSWTIASSFGTVGAGDPVLVRPWGVAMDAGGYVYVSDVEAHKVKKYSSTGVFQCAWGYSGPVKGALNAPRGIDVNASGIVHVADAVNDRIQVFVQPLRIDILAPADGSYHRTSVVPVVNFDPLAVSSGIELDGAPWDYQPVSAQGVHVLRAWAMDEHGLTHEKVAQFVIDTEAPITASNAVASYSNVASINLLPADALSGVVSTQWTLDGGAVRTGTALTVTTAGEHVLRFWSTDLAGNVEPTRERAFTVTDTLPPLTTSDAKAEYAEQAHVHLSAFDSGSTVASTYYVIDHGSLQAGTEMDVSGHGPHTIEYWSTDTAGNVEATKTASFSIKAKTALSVSRSASVVAYGGAASIRATLKSGSGALLKNKPLTLYRSYDASSWAPIATVTSTTGYYSRSVTLSRLTYFKWAFSSDTAYASSSAATRVDARARLYAPIAPATVNRATKRTVYGDMRPRHKSGSRVVTLYLYRYESGRWVRRGTPAVLTVRDYSSYSRYSGYVTFPYRGKWRVRAHHDDADHASTFSAYDYVTVR